MGLIIHAFVPYTQHKRVSEGEQCVIVSRFIQKSSLSFILISYHETQLENNWSSNDLVYDMAWVR